MKTIFALGKQLRSQSSKRSNRSASTERREAPPALSERRQAPHPIPAGSEGAVCPMTGLYANGTEAKPEMSAAAALAELEADADIAAEHDTLIERREQSQQPSHVSKSSLPMLEVPRNPLGSQPFTHTTSSPYQPIPVNVMNGAHKSNSKTKQLVRAIGGLPTLRRFTELFYQKSFADRHIDKFIRRHEDPHGERLSNWIAEKLGDGTPWTDERRNRPVDTMDFGGGQVQKVAFDRSSAHFAAWHSPKREAHKWGEHFKPDDARVWMRLHFWAAREVGLFEPENAAFMDYYVRFIGHFISVYSSKSPPFARESARWSADPANIERYLAAGNYMTDVIDKSVEKELSNLPHDERLYTGSKASNPSWPYSL